MNSEVVIQGQSLLDMAIQKYGTIAAVVVLAAANSLSVTDEVPAGYVLLLPDYENTDTDIAGYYEKKGIKPATVISKTVEDIIENNDDCNLCKCFT